MNEARRIERQVSKAATEPVVEAVRRFYGRKRTWPSMRTNSPIYGFGIKKLLTKQFETASATDLERLLADYLAHSMTGHLFDGWRYLTQSLVALTSSANAKAIHFAYYAELRAACSLLASCGIGILNGRNYVLDLGGHIHWFGLPTHQATWIALENWAERPNTSDLIYSMFQFGGLNGKEWATACDPSGAGMDIPKTWINKWAVDLSAVHKDQDLRNQFSYNPNLTTTAFKPVQKKDLDLLAKIKESTLRTGEGIVHDLDKAIIQQLCNFFLEKCGNNSTWFWPHLTRQLTLHFRMTEKDAKKKVRLVQKPMSRSVKTLFTYAQGPVGEDAHPHNLICRALFLLRVATSLNRSRWKAATTSRLMSQSEQWREKLLLSFAISSSTVHDGASLDDVLQISLDEDVALSTIKKVLHNQKASDMCGYSLWKDYGNDLMNLARLERLCVRTAA